MIDFVATFITFFAVIDPIGTVPVFVAVTQRYDEAKKRKVALVATGVSAGVLLFFVIAGEVILTAMSIPLPAFRIAGGLVLFLFAITMILGESKPEQEVSLADSTDNTAIFPLAVPSLASPGAMLAAVLLTENARYNFSEQAQTVLMVFAVLVVALGLMLVAGRIQRLIGASGASIISRVMGLILASAAIHNVLQGIKSYFAI